MTRDEALAQALFAALSGVAGPVVRRGGADVEEIGAAGLVNQVDGQPTEIAELLGGDREMMVEHDVELAVAIADDAARAAAHADLAARLAAAVLADAPLRALADHVRLHPLRDRQTIPMPGAAPVLSATLPVELHYTTTRNPLEDV